MTVLNLCKTLSFILKYICTVLENPDPLPF